MIHTQTYLCRLLAIRPVSDGVISMGSGADILLVFLSSMWFVICVINESLWCVDGCCVERNDRNAAAWNSSLFPEDERR